MKGLGNKEDSIDEDSNSGTDDCNRENDDETACESTYFNYNYSYDFVPDWMRENKDKETTN